MFFFSTQNLAQSRLEKQEDLKKSIAGLINLWYKYWNKQHKLDLCDKLLKHILIRI